MNYIYTYYIHVLASYYHGTLHDLIVWCILIRMFLSWRNPSEAYQKSVQSSIFQPRSRGWLVSRSTEGRICSRHAAGSESGCAAEHLYEFLKDKWTRIDPEKADVRHMLERWGILAAKITHADQILTVTGEQLQSLHFECPQPTEKSDSWRVFFNIEIKPSILTHSSRRLLRPAPWWFFAPLQHTVHFWNWGFSSSRKIDLL